VDGRPEALRAFERELDAKRRLEHLKVNVVFRPTSRGDFLPALVEGRGDIAVGALSITPDRLEQVDFTAPMACGVNEIAVTGPRSPPSTIRMGSLLSGVSTAGSVAGTLGTASVLIPAIGSRRITLVLTGLLAACAVGLFVIARPRRA
jgi:ABC-type amino acid transport substrate-binding protein